MMIFFKFIWYKYLIYVSTITPLPTPPPFISLIYNIKQLLNILVIIYNYQNISLEYLFFLIYKINTSLNDYNIYPIKLWDITDKSGNIFIIFIPLIFFFSN
uniref:hypothetical protein n=1 Tax=Pappia fissilis TaxID=1040649 RepID=UPI002A82562C|nr:hypothetical protein UYP79_mgp043 [Pappia fissilis]WOX61293.1 hypothetical protein [Pappia fissilis]